MKHLTCLEVEPLLPATAAGALDRDEEEPVKEHLATCPPCVQHLHDYQETVEQLAFTVPQVAPPAGLRSKVLQSVAVTPAPRVVADRPAAVRVLPGARTQQAAGRVPGRYATIYRQWAPAVLAACLVLLVGSGIWLGIMQQQMASLKQRLDQQAAVRSILSDPGSSMQPLRAVAPNSAVDGGVIMAPGSTRVAIMAAHLPPPAAGHAYKVWLLKHDNSPPRAAGLLAVDGDGVAMMVVDTQLDPYQMAGLRVTDESSPSSPTPSGRSWLEGWWH